MACKLLHFSVILDQSKPQYIQLIWYVRQLKWSSELVLPRVQIKSKQLYRPYWHKLNYGSVQPHFLTKRLLIIKQGKCYT